MLLDLAQVTSYHNGNVLARYQRDYPHATLTAEQALNEFLKFVWLYHQHQNDLLHSPNDPSLAFDCAIHSEMQEIDNMWHTFLLFTKDYHKFCQEYLHGQFFHHVPNTHFAKDVNASEFEKNLALFLGYVYDKLGEETLLTWFPLL